MLFPRFNWTPIFGTTHMPGFSLSTNILKMSNHAHSWLEPNHYCWTWTCFGSYSFFQVTHFKAFKIHTINLFKEHRCFVIINTFFFQQTHASSPAPFICIIYWAGRSIYDIMEKQARVMWAVFLAVAVSINIPVTNKLSKIKDAQNCIILSWTGLFSKDSGGLTSPVLIKF